MKRYTLHNGDNREVLKTFEDNSIDSIVCDPPYELGFMGKRWDSTGIAYNVTLWTECLRVLKPGGHLLAFGGTRTYHRMTVAIEDAGFEIRESIAWIYSTGFPKSHNLHGEHQGWGTALKPAHEPIVVARKPLQGTVADNVQAWGVGALNIDGCRVGGDDGRWPANIILDEEAAQMLDEQSGGASRFFYIPKASKAEREAGLEGMEVKVIQERDKDGNLLASEWRSDPRSPNGGYENKPTQPRANNHPTVKPIALMRYLVRMVTPRGGVVLDPFMGSGTTGCAAMLEAVRFIGIELNEEYSGIAEHRIRYWMSQNMMGI